ncbi:hypothetical protein Calag_0218 [Caldisphaera lagunensis DSM 15908]|uniref:Uncharacterized protein n=1 Tax=Caldisphaera lagunensis (strain DSM 15908 / JCM 11604 / ANMR 0165 / IC-154) TaxID=1056495 RepID=L0AAD3_CALLD|nr:hypothetical protein [Caldisphaera lagunensis]AFZ70000.1 hypothetical protein Calag_0218 [Caldisphaera lagunensis DSM 15908]
MRLPRTWIDSSRKNEENYEARITVEIYPGVNFKIYINKLAQKPVFACCTGRENKICNSYIISLFSQSGPFASLYILPPWLVSKCKEKIN